MKVLINILTALCFLSCSKEEPILEEEFYNGTASAKINGQNFDLSPRMDPTYGNDSAYSLQIHYLIGDNVKRKQIFFQYLVNTDIKQSLIRIDSENRIDPQCDYSTSLYDGDVFGNYYYLNEEDLIDDYIQLTSFDELTGKISGKFQASFVVDTSLIFDPGSPDTIVITDGYFETIIFK